MKFMRHMGEFRELSSDAQAYLAVSQEEISEDLLDCCGYAGNMVAAVSQLEDCLVYPVGSSGTPGIRAKPQLKSASTGLYRRVVDLSKTPYAKKVKAAVAKGVLRSTQNPYRDRNRRFGVDQAPMMDDTLLDSTGRLCSLVYRGFSQNKFARTEDNKEFLEALQTQQASTFKIVRHERGAQKPAEAAPAPARQGVIPNFKEGGSLQLSSLRRMGVVLSCLTIWLISRPTFSARSLASMLTGWYLGTGATAISQNSAKSTSPPK